HLRDDVARLQAGARGRLVLEDVVHQDAVGFLDAELGGQLRGHFLDADAQPAAYDFPLGTELVHDLLHHVGGNGEADALGIVDDGGVDADHLAFDIEQRSSAVAGIDRGVCLDERLVAGKSDGVTLKGGGKAHGDGSIQCDTFDHDCV